MSSIYLNLKGNSDNSVVALKADDSISTISVFFENLAGKNNTVKSDSKMNEIYIDDLIKKVKSRFELKTIYYLSPSFPGRSLSHPYQLLTCPEECADYYKINHYAMIDSVIKVGSRSLLPIDWSKLPRKHPSVQKLFGESQDFGLGKQGLTIPLRGPVSGIWGLFTATSDDDDWEWKARYYELLRDLVEIARYIHQRAYDMHVKNDPIALNTITRRENEALSWSAEGKSIDDISVLMAISPETVKAHLDSARHKLGALNRVHAVAKAIRAGLIR